MKLEDLTINASVQGVLADSLVTVVSVRWFGDSAVELTYKTPSGQVANELLYRDDESRIEAVEAGSPLGLRRGRIPVPSGFRGPANSFGPFV